ncbi:MAG TPA: TolC family protein [Kofleriaceae bacterium]|nr:TolC family protein [Kofleriaceae bacterium]
MPALLAVAGCAGSLDRTHDYDTMLGALRRDDAARSDGDAALAAVTSAQALDRTALVRAVLARNPTLGAMRAAWHAAAADVRAAGTLEDPMVTYELAPLSIASSAPFGQRVQVSQKLPWPGKRAVAGDIAVADAEMAHQDVRGMTLELAAMTSDLFDDYALVERELEVNDHHRMTAEQMKKAVEAQLAAGRGSTQDALAAEVELGKMAQERVMLETERETIVARLDGLLHRAPDAPLPAPAAVAPVVAEPAPLAQLLARAAERPDARSANERIAGASARVEGAERAFYPDLEVMGSYDSMFMPEHRWMVGVGIEVPLQRGKRDAELDAARARVTQATAQLDRLRDDVKVDVFSARRAVVESNAIVTSYDQQLVPATRAQVEAALQGFVTGRNDFTAVITAERSAREIELASYRARTELSKRLVALDKATGRLPGGGVP